MAASGARLLGKGFVSKQLTKLLPREMKNVMRRTTLTIAKEMRDGIRSRAPKRIGTLRKAIIHKRSKGRRGVLEAKVMITKGKQEKHDAFYWHMVEFGTVHSAPNPFISPVIAEHRPKYAQRLTREVRLQVIRELENRAKKQKVKVK